MRIKVQVNVDSDQILRNRGLGDNGKVAKYMASEAKRLMEPYTPKQQGQLSSPQIVDGGKHLYYKGPYAHYQYTGIVMEGRAPKHYTSRPLTHTDSQRGKEWDKRMMANCSKELADSVENYIKSLG